MLPFSPQLLPIEGKQGQVTLFLGHLNVFFSPEEFPLEIGVKGREIFSFFPDFCQRLDLRPTTIEWPFFSSGMFSPAPATTFLAASEIKRLSTFFLFNKK